MYDINENLNSIISTKNALANVLAENGVQAGNVFSEYPQMFRSVIAAGGGGTSGDVIYAYISDYLSTYNYIDQEALSDCSYITLADVPSVDLSSYVTKAELSGMSYVTSSDLSSASYVTNAQLQSASYVTSSDLSSASYITATYISNHDIIPATNEFYTLGNAAYRYLQIATKHAFVTDDLAFGTQKITH